MRPVGRSTVIIAQRGLSDLTIACVRTLQAWNDPDTDIVVVDDGSLPADSEWLRAIESKSVRILTRMAEGLTAAWNAGAAVATGESLVFLNNDVVTRGPWLEELRSALASVVVAGIERRVERKLPEATLSRLPSRVFAAGWCFALRRRDFEAAGGFDERLRLYYSDTDLQARLLARAGRGEDGIEVTRSAPLVHRRHATTSLDPRRRDLRRADRRTFIGLWNDPGER